MVRPSVESEGAGMRTDPLQPRLGQVEAGSVVGLWRYPVKSMIGEELNAAEVTDRGLVGAPGAGGVRGAWSGAVRFGARRLRRNAVAPGGGDGQGGGERGGGGGRRAGGGGFRRGMRGRCVRCVIGEGPHVRIRCSK